MRTNDSQQKSINLEYIENLYQENLTMKSLEQKNFWSLLQEARLFSDQLNKTGISLGHTEGRLLSTLIALHSCKTFVEIGTLTGSSGLWILQGLKNLGHLMTFENNPAHAEKAKMIFAKYKDLFPHKNQQSTVYLGNAEEEILKINDLGPFDGIFIDGNKSAYGRYLDWAEKNIKVGGLIIADNVFLSGGVWGEQDHPFSDKQIQIMQNFNRRLNDENKYKTCFVPTSEGLSVSIKLF